MAGSIKILLVLCFQRVKPSTTAPNDHKTGNQMCHPSFQSQGQSKFFKIYPVLQ